MIDFEKMIKDIKGEMLAPEIEVKPGTTTTLEISGLFNKNIEASELKRHRDSMLKIFNEHGIEMNLREDKSSYKGEFQDKKGVVSAHWILKPLEGEKLIISLNKHALNKKDIDKLNEQVSNATKGFEKIPKLVKLVTTGDIEKKHLDLLQSIAKNPITVDKKLSDQLKPLTENNIVIIESNSARLKTNLSFEDDLKKAKEMAERIKNQDLR